MRLVSYAATESHALVGRGGTSTIVITYPPHANDDMTTDRIDALTTATKHAAPALHANGRPLRAPHAGDATGSGHSPLIGELISGAP